ncbi:bifunctional folylpolyglutamate synthase/dihydrofolate synthase [Marinicella sp. W31]|uniref:bifunctional folylpolyglutamate synthase/dihydrofolate synthase n=1 Tax=Marinicella sp. W31 TaxID=3023713 RepID=UPI003757EFEF
MTRLSLNDWLKQLNQDKIDLGLDRVRTALERLSLQIDLPPVITVAGTNGKGSTVAAVSALAQAHNLNVGTFTSPHLQRFNERITVNGVMAEDAAIIDAFESIQSVSSDINLSYFEYAVLAALLNFKQHQVDLIVLEVGLGGRLDATNVIDANCCIITTIDLDHMTMLGNDREQIGKEKAGIMRPHTPVVFGSVDCPSSVQNYAKEIDAQLLRIGHDYHLRKQAHGYDLHTPKGQRFDLTETNLKGDWQYYNLAAAIVALEALDIELQAPKVDQALSHVRLNGRLQLIQDKPQVILDVAHNVQSVEMLTEWLQKNPVQGATRAVFSVLQEKQAEQWLSHIDAAIDHWFIAEVKGSERGVSKSDLLTLMAEEVKMVSAFNNLVDAYENALLCSEPEDRVIVFGSFYVLAEIYQHLSK